LKFHLKLWLKNLAKRAIEFISEIRRKYGDSVVELRKATGKLTIEQIEREIKQMNKEQKI